MEKEIKHNDLTNKLLIILLIITIIANGIQIYNYKANERFDWTAGVISSKGNIIQVSNCNFKGNFYKIDKNMILGDSWDKINESENKINNTFLPDSLSIKWFCYNDQKFYNGSFSLPNEIILKKVKQMDITASNNNDLNIIAEVQPKGKLTVWIQTFDKNDHETKFKIGTYQAKEINATWHIFDDYSEHDTTSNINITKKVVLVMERHSYKLEIKLPIGYHLDPSYSYFTLFNQNNWIFNINKHETTPTFNFLPKGFNLTWRNGRKNFSTQFTFDEDELLEVFRKESNNINNSESLVLELIVNDNNNVLKVRLKNTKTNSETVFRNKYKSRYDIIQLR